MFSSNITKVYCNFECDNDCEKNECHGHVMKIEIDKCSSLGCILLDEDEILWMTNSQADALLSLLIRLKKYENK